MTSAVIGKGTLFKRGDGASPEVFTTVAEVKSISGPELSRDTLDVTNMDSTGNFREFVATLQDGGSVSFDINLIGDNTSQNNLDTDMNNGTARNFQMLLPNVGATLYSFTGLVTGFSVAVEIDGIITASITIKITGAVTRT